MSRPRKMSFLGAVLLFGSWSLGAEQFSNAITGVSGEISPDVFADEVNAKKFGAVGDGIVDDTSALQSAIDYAQKKKTKVYIPGGTYLVTATLKVPEGLEVSGAGGIGGDSRNGSGTTLLASADDILVLSVTSGCRLSRLAINGANRAYWGVMVSGARPVLQNVEVFRCKEYGIVCNQTQNGTFLNVCCRFNACGLVLANGTRNCSYYNFTSEVNHTYYRGRYEDARCLLLLIDISNPHGYGLAKNVTANGNDNNRFFGGINERCAGVLETRTPGSFTGVAAGINYFYSVEFTGARILITDSPFGGTFVLDACSFISDNQTDPMCIGTSGAVIFRNPCYFSGADQVVERGWTMRNNFHELLRTASDDFIEPNLAKQGSPFQYSGGGSLIGFNPSTKTFSISAGSPIQGLSVVPAGGWNSLSGANITQVAAYIRSRRPVMRIRFTADNVVGADGTIMLYAALAAPPYRREIRSYRPGTYELLYKCQGDELGVAFCLNGCRSFDISNIVVDFP